MGATLEQPANRPTPLWASYAFTFVNSIGSCIVTSSGLYFLTRQGYAFTDTQNFLLAVLLGMVYIVGAKLAARLPAVVGRGMSNRGLLAGLMAGLGALCLVPVFVPAAAWVVWFVVLSYSLLTGMLWPVVESYVSGGRSGARLRSTMSWWNVTWSSSGVVAVVLVSPLVEDYQRAAFATVSGMHLAALALLLAFAPEPQEHPADGHEPHPAIYAQLLVAFRMLLPMGYAVSTALGPYLPHAAEHFEIAPGSRALLATAWLLPRVVMFVVMRGWQGWHGRWFLALAGGAGVLGGFAAAVSATHLGAAGFYVLLGGLALFGAAMAAIYTAALYYAMEVGKAEVGAGGTHEALIGTGYTIGPLFGLAASLGVDWKVLPEDLREPVMLGGVLLLGVVTAGLVARRVVRGGRPATNGAVTPD